MITDEKAAAVAVTEDRVTAEYLNSLPISTEYFNPDCAPHVTICVIQVRNGFVLVGKSAPADPANFDADLGREFARDDALRQLWALEGYLLRQCLMQKQAAEMREYLMEQGG